MARINGRSGSTGSCGERLRRWAALKRRIGHRGSQIETMRGMTHSISLDLSIIEQKENIREEECPDLDPESCQMQQQSLYPAAPKRLKVCPSDGKASLKRRAKGTGSA